MKLENCERNITARHIDWRWGRLAGCSGDNQGS